MVDSDNGSPTGMDLSPGGDPADASAFEFEFSYHFGHGEVAGSNTDMGSLVRVSESAKLRKAHEVHDTVLQKDLIGSLPPSVECPRSDEACVTTPSAALCGVPPSSYQFRGSLRALKVSSSSPAEHPTWENGVSFSTSSARAAPGCGDKVVANVTAVPRWPSPATGDTVMTPIATCGSHCDEQATSASDNGFNQIVSLSLEVPAVPDMPPEKWGSSYQKGDLDPAENDTVYLYVDGFELLYEAYRSSVVSLDSNKASGTTVSQSDVEAASWYLGTGKQLTPEAVPLLRTLRLCKRVDPDGAPELVLWFPTLNLAVVSTELSGWRDRHGKQLSMGDVALFAFQQQTGITTSRHITALGHLPIPLLSRKALASALKASPEERALKGATLNKEDSAGYGSLRRAKAFAYNSNFPVEMPSLEVFTNVFRGVYNTPAALPVNIVVEKHLYRQQTNGCLSDVHSAGRRPSSQSGASTANHKAYTVQASSVVRDTGGLNEAKPRLDGMTTKAGSSSPGWLQGGLVASAPGKEGASMRDRLRRKFTIPVYRSLEKSPSMFSAVVVADLVSPFSMSRVEGLPGADIAALYESHAPQALRLAQSVYKASNASRAKDDAAFFGEKKRQLFQAIPDRKHSSKTLLEYLKLKRAKPIIILPSGTVHGASVSALHFKNSYNFLVHQQLLSEGRKEEAIDPTNKSTPFFPNGVFHWTVNIPNPYIEGSHTGGPEGKKSKPDDPGSVEIKVVDTAQVVKFHAGDWYRTIAVVLQGPEWQLAEWPFTSTENLFACIKPVYFAYESDPLPPLVERHAVEVLRLKRTARHGDATAWVQFTKSLGSILYRPRNFKLFDAEKMKTTYGK